MKIPPAHVEDLTGDVIADAIASAFEGRSVGEFVVLAEHDHAARHRRLLSSRARPR